MTARRVALALLLVTSACARPPQATCATAPAASAAPSPAKPKIDDGPSLTMTLTPKPGAEPSLAVEIVARGATLNAELRGVTSVRGLVAEDANGALGTQIVEGGVRLARAPVPPLRVRYEVLASGNPRAPTRDLVVADDRFRGLGESFVLIPRALVDAPTEITVAIGGHALAAPDSATSLGTGSPRTVRATGALLARSAFVAGSLERAVFDGAMEHDEAAWLGYTAFDPRPASAEIASVRTALRERWKGEADERFTMLFVSSARPAGAWALVPRARSLLVHLGPSEPWSGALRLGIAQHLQTRWIGGELRMGRSDADGLWFTDGVGRVLAAELLRELGLFTADDAQALVNGLLGAQALSPPGSKTRPAAMGGLHALRVAALLGAKGTSLQKLVFGLLERVRDKPGPMTEETWRAALASQLGEAEARAFDEALRGRDVVLPDGALGPCFRATTATHATFVLGFDAAASFESEARTIKDLDPKGPAAAAGLRATDVLEEAVYRQGNAEVPVRLAVMREGKRVELGYAPRGETRRGALFVRARQGGDDVCGSVLP